MAVLKLLRFPNLLIVGLTQVLLYQRILIPALREEGVRPVFGDFEFGLFVLVTVLITAIGYVINDITDYKIDLVNRPGKVIVGQKISFATAYWLTALMGLTGFFASLYLAFYVGQPHLLVLYPAALAGLYGYSTNFKKRAFIGNLMIAVYCSAAAGVLWLAELPALKTLELTAPTSNLRVWTVFLWFMVFAFLATLFREIIKDIEDIQGDSSHDCRTIPILWGERRAKILAAGFGIALLIFLVWYSYFYREQFGFTALTYMVLAIDAPLLLALRNLRRASGKEAYRRISQISKLIIFTGILLLLFIR